MDEILSKPKEERAQIFQEAAARSKEIKSSIIFEKDFWVCWTLDQLFSIPEIGPYITFKGGTSLSKCYNIINRFSEDCDITLNKEFIGIAENAATISKKGRKQRDKSIKALTEAAEKKVTLCIKPLLIKNFKINLSNYFSDSEWRIETDPEDKQSLLFHYPSSLSRQEKEYIQSS